ncbi:MAG: hypothetical protein RIF32_21105 [Leptospirales bacterium]|jgi:hypothetical protein
MPDQRFPYKFDHSWNALFFSLGVSKDDGVQLTADGRLVATFGRWRVETPLDNIASTEIDGPHQWFMAVGLRLAFTNDGLTFGTNHRRGVSIRFHERIPKVFGFRDHSMLWVSVEDCAGLAAAIGK